MKPVLIATPRSGSTIIGELIGDLAVQLWGSKGWLNEFFNINQNLVTEVKIINDRLYLQRNQYVDQPWCLDVSRERQIRKQYVDNDPNYVIKFLVSQVEDWTVDWITENNYTPIFVERRDKIKQLLSFLTSKKTNSWYYHKSRENQPVTEIIYDEETALKLVWILREYKVLKNKFKNPITIYYEDFIDKGGNQKAIAEILGIGETFIETQTDSAVTPYLKDPESLISNDQAWLEAKDRITKLLNQIL